MILSKKKIKQVMKINKEITSIKQVDLYVDNKYINEFETFEEFIKYYGLLCSTLNIKEINYSKHNDSSVSVRIITIEEILKIIDYGLEYKIY